MNPTNSIRTKTDLETRINNMDLSEQLNLVLTVPWEQRFEIITASEKAKEIVANMPVEELFWTIKATGIEDSAIILGLTTPEQLQFIFDLDWWHKDELRVEKIVAWFIVMFELCEGNLKPWLTWILQRDQWLFPAILNKFIKVVKRPDDMDIQEAKDLLPPFTLDNVYYIDFKKKKLAPLFMRVIASILELDAGIYRDVLETMLWETPSYNHEIAYKLRCGRIGDFGIPDYYDSLDIYVPLEPNQMHTMNLEDPVLQALPVNYDMPPFVPTLYVSGFPALEEAIGNLAGRPLMERIVREATGVANKILMADRVDLDDPKQLKGALKKAFSMINLGLQHLSLLMNKKPYEILMTHYLEEIARISSGLLLPIGMEARNILSKDSFKALPHHLKPVVEEAAQKPSMLFINGLSSFVTTLSDLETLKGLMAEVAAWNKILNFLVPSPNEWPKAIEWKQTNMLAPEELAADSGLATAVANLLLKAKFQIEPLDKNALEELGERLKSSTEEEIRTFLQDVLAPVCSKDKTGLDCKELEAIIIPRTMEILGEAMSNKEGSGPEPRYIKNLLVYVE